MKAGDGRSGLQRVRRDGGTIGVPQIVVFPA